MANLEDIKAAEDGLGVGARIEQFARNGFASIPEDDFERLKWYGLYVHKPTEAERFLLRVRLPGGRLTPAQATVLAQVADEFGGGRLDVTTRQDIQIHSLRIEDVPAILDTLSSVGLSSVHACGDTPRNVVGCPLGDTAAPFAGNEALVRQITKALVGRPECSNFPRKYKVAVSSCLQDCVMSWIHDVGLRATRLEGRPGYDVVVGGGLSSTPHVAQRLGVFAPLEETADLVTAIAEVFRVHGYRERRNHARMKFLVADWGVGRFREVVEEELGRSLEPLESDDEGELAGPTDHLGIIPIAGNHGVHLGVPIPAGILTAEQLRALAATGAKELRATVHQNLVAFGVPKCHLAAAQQRLGDAGLGVGASDWSGCVETCTGMDFCRRAAAFTKPAARAIAEALNGAAADGPRVRVHLTGCPNSCGRVHLGEVGLSGCVLRDGDERARGFELWFGGRHGGTPAVAEPSGWKIREEEAAEVVRGIVSAFRVGRQPDESFGDFFARVGLDSLRGSVAGL
jgi:ferredoxin-nitrite reductase